MRYSLTVLGLILLVGCQTIKRANLSQLSLKNGLSKHSINANDFELSYLANNQSGSTLHIYIEGDGLPWLNRFTISADPSPRNPLALSLMSQDPSKAIYITRPCYFLAAPDKKCNSSLWTDARYGELVIDTMQSAIEQIIEQQQVEQIILIGYSGGGVVASLLAERLEILNLYVTIAANLDIKKWTEHHQYSELRKSINPFEVEPAKFPLGIHFIGGADQVVPQKISEQFIKQTNSQSIVIKQNDHTCCWVSQWPELLEQVNTLSDRD